MLCAVMMTFNAWVYITDYSPSPDKYPTILIHRFLGAVVLVLINILIARMITKTKKR
ncbi:hypothetical protein O9993_08550 [Vibrio lentus]|nr:hypothetical protein [Vibrio lentus]